MNTIQSEVPVGQYIAAIREAAGISQAQLAQSVTLSPATLSRIESGEKIATEDELAAMLNAIGGPKASELAEFLSQDWDQLPRPTFAHPNRDCLWAANAALRTLAELRSDPELKAVFIRQVDLYEQEIRRVADFLASTEHQIAYIGSIGVGKSTAICKLTGLLRPDEDKLDRQIVLETGAGGITLCEVQISRGPRYGLRIVPRDEDSIRRDVEDFCDYLMSSTKPANPAVAPASEEEDDPLGISKEVVRAIRNMAKLTERRKEENGRRIRIDPAKELAQRIANAQELCIEILTRMDLLRRNRRDAWYPQNSVQSPAQWLQEMFSAINNGRNPEFTLPQKIEVVVPEAIFGTSDLDIRIVDTKGIDQAAERQDIECHFDDPRTLVALCSRFNDAPEVALQNLLRRAKDAGARDISQKTVLFVLPRPDEALAVKYDDGARVEDDVEGYDLKRDQVHLRLNQHGLSDVPVEFFNAREEGPKEMRQRFIDLITRHRSQYAGQVDRLAIAVNRLAENRQDEQIRLVFEHVMSDLNAWIQSNRSITLTPDGVEQQLVNAIDGTRYASTIRASVRRYGDWYNLDYYHHLAYGVRTLAVEHIGTRVEQFRTIVNMLIANEELAPAKGYLESIQGRVDAAVDEAYRRIQAAGREAFKQTLAKDFEFWGKCESRWGQGPGYRTDIRDMTDDEFDQEFLVDVQKLVVAMLAKEWEAIVELMVGLLQENQMAQDAA